MALRCDSGPGGSLSRSRPRPRNGLRTSPAPPSQPDRPAWPLALAPPLRCFLATELAHESYKLLSASRSVG